MHAHTHLVTHLQTTKPRKYSQTRTQTLARARAHTHTLKRTHTHHAPAYAMGATAVHTLLSSEAYAHTIILLCRRSHDEMRGVRVERRNGYSNETGCVVFIASGAQCRAHSYPMQRPLPEG